MMFNVCQESIIFEKDKNREIKKDNFFFIVVREMIYIEIMYIEIIYIIYIEIIIFSGNVILRRFSVDIS